MIKILLVEDELEAAEKFQSRLKRTPVNPTLRIAGSRDSAVDLLGQDEFDLTVCDLLIPTVDGGLDVAEAHGWRVLDACRTLAPGTPVILLSAIVDLPKSRVWLEAGLPDLFGDGSNLPSATAYNKDDADAVMGAVQRVGDALDRLEAVPIGYEEPGRLTQMEERLLRIYATRKRAAKVIVEHEYAGYSGARIVRARLFNERDQSAELVIFKIGSLSRLVAETGQYDRHVAHLGPGQIAQSVARIAAGAAKLGAVVYALADGHRHNLYELLETPPPDSAAVIARLRSIQARWEESTRTQRVKIRAIRRALVPDQKLQALADTLNTLPWQAFEDRDLTVPYLIQHCDLHGGNILVDPALNPLVIDYAQVGEAAAGLDPITIELSLVLQAPAKAARAGWPTAAQCEDWSHLETYLVNSPFRQVIAACRQWALEVAGSTGAVSASAYGYALRQLQYDDTNHELALAIIRGLTAAPVS